MAQAKIIVDTNSYLRLAQSIDPLLLQEFGVEQYCLYALPELNDELSNRKLKSSFSWTQQPSYSENRSVFPNMSKKQKKSLTETFDFLWAYVKANELYPSKVDTSYIAHGIELEIPVVTDDQNMIKLAVEQDVEAISTLNLMKLMLDSSHIDIAKVKSIAKYWQAISDCPANFKSDLKSIFNITI